MKEKIYVISDTEMGRGDTMDDFQDDQILADFINKISELNRNSKTTLVLNGDILDFLKMAYKDNYPRYITEEISFWKLNEVIQIHKIVFEALKKFLADPAHSLHFVIGNHDADLVWPGLQKKIKEILNCPDRINFGFSFDTNEIHAEHGHLVDPFFHINIKKPIVKFKGKEILNLPWGAQAIFHYLVDLKRKFPVQERMFPRGLTLKKEHAYRRESHKTIFKLAIKEILINPILHLLDPTYGAPYFKFLQHMIHHGIEVIDDRKFLMGYFRQVIKKNPSKQILLLGHLHLYGMFNFRNHRCIVTDTWRSEVNTLNPDEKKKKSYAEMTYNGGTLKSAELKTFD